MVEEEHTLATCVFRNMAIIFVTWVGPDLVPDPLERAEVDFEELKFITRCFSLNLFRKESSGSWSSGKNVCMLAAGPLHCWP